MLKKVVIRLAALGVGLYLLFVRPWQLRWGATDEEASQAMPGDDQVKQPRYISTRAITIKAPAADVWPWLVQIGTGRAGWYSYDWLENLLPESARGSGIINAERIIPELQHLEVGDSVPLSPTTGFTVVEIEPTRALALHATMDLLTGLPVESNTLKRGTYLDGSWTFVLRPLDEGTTRLIARVRYDYQPRLWGALIALLLLEPAHFVMERKMLLGIKQRAEREVKEGKAAMQQSTAGGNIPVNAAKRS